MAAEIDAMREARADELGQDREQPEAQSRQKALVTTRPLHVGMIGAFAQLFATVASDRRAAPGGEGQPTSVSV